MEIYIILLFSVLIIAVVTTVTYNVVKIHKQAYIEAIKRIGGNKKSMKPEEPKQETPVVEEPIVEQPQPPMLEQQPIPPPVVEQPIVEQPMEPQEPIPPVVDESAISSPIIGSDASDIVNDEDLQYTSSDNSQYASDVVSNDDKPKYYEPADYSQYSIAINPQIQASLNALNSKYSSLPDTFVSGTEHFDNRDCKQFKCDCVDDEYLVTCFANLVDDINKWKIYSDKVMYVNSIVPSYGYDRLADNVCNCVKKDHEIDYGDKADSFKKINKKLKDLEKALEFKTNRATICRSNKKNCTNTENALQYSEDALQYSDNNGKEMFTSSDDNKVVTSYDIVNDVYTTKLNNGRTITYEPFNNDNYIHRMTREQAEDHLTNILKLIHDKNIALTNL